MVYFYSKETTVSQLNVFCIFMNSHTNHSSLIYLGLLVLSLTILLKHFISITFILLLSSLLISPLYRHFLGCKPNLLAKYTFQRTPCQLFEYSTFIQCATSILHPPSVAPCCPKYWKTIYVI